MSNLNTYLKKSQSLLKIDEDTVKDNLLLILSDKYCRTILKIITNKPKSVVDITAETRIPISTVYRRIQILENNNLLSSSGMVSEDGKKTFLYKSKIKGIKGTFDNGKIDVKLILNK